MWGVRGSTVQQMGVRGVTCQAQSAVCTDGHRATRLASGRVREGKNKAKITRAGEGVHVNGRKDPWASG